MAMVAADLPRPSTVVTVDSRELLGELEEVEAREYDPSNGLPKAVRAYVVCRDPKMTVAPHFFSEPECDHLVELVRGYWMPSLVGTAAGSSDPKYATGDLENGLSKTRTSWSCMLRSAQSSVIEHLEHRLASFAGLPLGTLERMNMVRYAPGELFNEHHDGKFRPMTVFVYLNEMPEEEEHGDTFFPYLGLSFRPRRGTAVMWSNVDGRTSAEDSRMLHAGRAPSGCIKYGVNCFFNLQNMRQVVPLPMDVPFASCAVVEVSTLGDDEGRNSSSAASPNGTPRKVVAYRLTTDPKIIAIPRLCSEEEVEHLLGMMRETGASEIGGDEDASGPYVGQTRVLRHLRAAETPQVEEIERRLAAASGLQYDCLAPLRVVRPGWRLGRCNRGCGPKAAYVCLSAGGDEVHFPRVGLRLRLGPGDMVLWPNSNWDTGTTREDLRTLRKHRPPGGAFDADASGDSSPACASVVGLDAYFHDNALRQQQGLREWVDD